MLKTAGKLAPEAKPRVVNLLFQAFFIYSRVAYTIFPHTFSEKWHLRQDAGRECATFAWGMRKTCINFDYKNNLTYICKVLLNQV